LDKFFSLLPSRHCRYPVIAAHQSQHLAELLSRRVTWLLFQIVRDRLNPTPNRFQQSAYVDSIDTVWFTIKMPKTALFKEQASPELREAQAPE
jgi:hypothetical protein